MPEVYDYAGRDILRKVNDSEETRVLANPAALGCARSPDQDSLKTEHRKLKTENPPMGDLAEAQCKEASRLVRTRMPGAVGGASE
jgi:hypothetical protein